MTTATPRQQATARWLLTAELGDGEGALAGPVAAAERVFQKLSDRLAGLFTLIGSEALVARAVDLSHAEFPFLDEARTARHADALTLRLWDCAAGAVPDQAREGFEAVLGTLIALLILFIGEDLTFRVLREVWPELPLVQPVQPYP